MVKEEEEKEQKKAIREQMVEEEKVRREIEREKQKIEKEEAQFSNEIKKLMSYMQKARDDIERQLYIDKIKELEEKLKALQVDKENVLQREQNTRAGFVYIISNIGSFGDRVFKIGMTRRLEPMERIAELSSASVPFPFDVHAMIFSENAPGLEAILHQHFDEMRVNKVNQRKEFFKVDLDDIKKVVLENHNATVKFVDIPDATEYRETLKKLE
jgi:phage membrane protein